MDSTRWTILGAVTVSMVAVAVFWATLPESGPLPAAAPPPPVAKVQAADAPSATPSPRPSRPNRPRPTRPPPDRGTDPGAAVHRARDLEGREVPEDVLQMIEEVRAERVANSSEKLAVYAELAEWDADTTARVQNLVATAHAEVDDLIAQASAGDVPWTDVRGEVRRIRVDQARAVRDELGEEEFRRFAKAMGRARGGRRGGRP